MLNGAFAKAFAGEGIKFDSHLGAFRITHSNQRDIVVTGQGEAALWTRRALERQGFQVLAQETPGADSINVLPNGVGWQLTTSQAKTHRSSLTEVLASLSQD